MVDVVTGGSSGSGGYQRQNFSVITDAKTSTSAEMSTRVRRYAITMAFRTACFIAMIFVPGVFRWILFGCAVFLPYVAVVLANQAHTRGRDASIEKPAPEGAPQLTTGPAPGEVITGDVIEGDIDDSGYPRDRERRG